MTIGTAIVISIGILAGAWLLTLLCGAWLASKKASDNKKLVDDISAKIIASRSKK